MCLHPVLGTTDIFLEQRVSYHGLSSSGRKVTMKKSVYSLVFLWIFATKVSSQGICVLRFITCTALCPVHSLKKTVFFQNNFYVIFPFFCVKKNGIELCSLVCRFFSQNDGQYNSKTLITENYMDFDFPSVFPSH